MRVTAAPDALAANVRVEVPPNTAVLAIRYAAARVSADSPVRNAATRSGEGNFAAGLTGEAPSVFAMPAPDFFREL